MKRKILTDQDVGSILSDPVKLSKEQKAQARENIGAVERTEPTDAKFFDIDYYGVVSLKPEYRGHPADETYPYSVSDNGAGNDGSKIDELPETIVIPEFIGRTAVSGFAAGIFSDNWRVREIVLPDTAAALPDRFCNGAGNLRSVKNTEHIISVGKQAFRNSGIEKALFPNLRELGSAAFGQAPLLHTVDIGDHITTIQGGTFANCNKLSVVKGGKSVTSLAASAFINSHSLTVLSFMPQLTSIGNNAFQNSRIQYDWSTLTGCTFGNNATPIADNTVNYWSGYTPTPCENPLNTLLCQSNPIWANETWGDNGSPYHSCCQLFAVMHAHSALSGKTYETMQEFENEVRELENESFFTDAIKTCDGVVQLIEALGYTATVYSGVQSAEAYEEICQKLNNGAYIFSDTSSASDPNAGHKILIYGINEYGEMLIADSDNMNDKIGIYDDVNLYTYALPLQNTTGPDSALIAIEKA